MPWKESSVIESMTDVCREFAISRKTGYKLLNR
jgi:hypothetical protein